MTRFKHSVVINRPVERVFAFVSDLANDPPLSGWHKCAGARRGRPVLVRLFGYVSGSWPPS
jgi:hypothetical protein